MDTQHHRRKERTCPLVWLRRNLVSLSSSRQGRCLQSSLTGRRVQDGGKSERRAVIARIGVASVSDNITPRESGQTSTRSSGTREPDQPTQETKQMTAACPAGAVSRPVTDWHAIPWRKV